MSIASLKGKGWLRDLPDYRDFTPSTDSVTKTQKHKGAKQTVNELLAKINDGTTARNVKAKAAAKDTRADLR